MRRTRCECCSRESESLQIEQAIMTSTFELAKRDGCKSRWVANPSA